MTTWTVYENDSHYYVKDLKSYRDRDQMLLYRYSYPESETPEVDAPYDAEKMLGALYDLFQCEDELKDGDVFETPHGRFLCTGVHVVPA